MYVYATAAKLGWRGPWRAAVEHGLHWIRTRHARPDGLHRTMTNRDGEAIDETATLYDQAFVLLALASAATMLTERAGELEEVGRVLLARIRQHFGHRGGFREEDPARPHQTNAQMHLFEAALAWTRASSDPAWAELADQVGTLCCTRFLDPETGALVEVYDKHWRPAAGDLAGLVEPGHQFEWAWLLQQWAWSKPDPDVVRAARRLFDVGGARRGPSAERNPDQDGLPVRLLVTAGQSSDKTAVPALLAGLPAAQALVADRGYDSRAILDLVAAAGGEAHIPNPAPRQAPALRRAGPPPPPQPRRTLLLQAHAVPTRGHPLRQARPQLPRRRRPRFSPHLAQSH